MWMSTQPFVAASVLVGSPLRIKLKIFSTGRISEKRNLRCYAAMYEVCRLQCPAPKELVAMTMMSAGEIGSSITSTHSATLKTGSNATRTIRDVVRRKLMLESISKFHLCCA